MAKTRMYYWRSQGAWVVERTADGEEMKYTLCGTAAGAAAWLARAHTTGNDVIEFPARQRGVVRKIFDIYGASWPPRSE